MGYETKSRLHFGLRFTLWDTGKTLPVPLDPPDVVKFRSFNRAVRNSLSEQ